MIVTHTPNSLPVEAQSDATAAPHMPDSTFILATLDPAISPDPVTQPREYVVRPGDTLSGIAAMQGVSLRALLEVNTLANPDVIEVGQVLQLPGAPDQFSVAFKIIPDSRLVRGPGATQFDSARFISQQRGYIRTATDTVNGDVLTAAQIVERVSVEFSVDARLLLTLLEYRAAWLSNPEPAQEKIDRPLGAGVSPLGFDRNGLYKQLAWAADRLNAGYYGWKYRNLRQVEFEDGTRFSFAPGLNAGTIGVQYLLSLHNDKYNWQTDIDRDGVYRTYSQLFGDPFIEAVEPLVPANLQQPLLTLPFAQGQTWFYSGGPHGGWGSGSAWAAIDFAPPDDLTTVNTACYISAFWATAVAPGLVVRSETGIVVLDLDYDGDEGSGWNILYLHLASDGRVPAGTRVAVGDKLGKPSCEGGVSNGTHIHVARKYNGEWLPANCTGCTNYQIPPFMMSNWIVIDLPGQEYQGWLELDGQRRIADQGRLTNSNHVAW
jgi:LysM repeat protein